GDINDHQKESVVLTTCGMPLHAKPEWPFGILDGLDGAIGRTGRRLEAWMGEDRLVVVTAHLHSITDEPTPLGAFAGGNRRPTKGVATRRVLLVAHNIW